MWGAAFFGFDLREASPYTLGNPGDGLPSAGFF